VHACTGREAAGQARLGVSLQGRISRCEYDAADLLVNFDTLQEQDRASLIGVWGGPYHMIKGIRIGGSSSATRSVDEARHVGTYPMLGSLPYAASMARRGIVLGKRVWAAHTAGGAGQQTKGRRSMFTPPEAPASSGGSVEIGPPPYYHRSDCHICRKQDGLKTGSELLDAPRPGGYIVEGEHFLVEHAPLNSSSAGTVILEAGTAAPSHGLVQRGRSDVAEDPS
jgi:hypothetical protein